MMERTKVEDIKFTRYRTILWTRLRYSATWLGNCSWPTMVTPGTDSIGSRGMAVSP